MAKWRVLALACLAAAGTFASPSSAATGDAASGGAMVTINGENRTFAFTAREHADGDRGQAQVQARQTGRRIHLELDCLRLIGLNKAVMTGVVTHSDDSVVPEGSHAIFTVVDNGEGMAALPDQISLVTTSAFDYDCEIHETAANTDVERGNVQVRPAI